MQLASSVPRCGAPPLTSATNFPSPPPKFQGVVPVSAQPQENSARSIGVQPCTASLSMPHFSSKEVVTASAMMAPAVRRSPTLSGSRARARAEGESCFHWRGGGVARHGPGLVSSAGRRYVRCYAPRVLASPARYLSKGTGHLSVVSRRARTLSLCCRPPARLRRSRTSLPHGLRRRIRRLSREARQGTVPHPSPVFF